MVLVLLKSISGKTEELELKPTDSFSQVEELLLARKIFRGDHLTFVYKGRRLVATDTIESIKYDTGSFLYVYSRTNNDQKKDANNEKLERMVQMGFDSVEAESALKKNDYNIEKALDSLQGGADHFDNPNLKLVQLFYYRPEYIKKMFSDYLFKIDERLAEKFEANPRPLLVLLGIRFEDEEEDDEITPNELSETDREAIQRLAEVACCDFETARDAYLQFHRDENLAVNYLLNQRT